ncbi:MAG: hypothetical protein WAU47_07410 [Desulfobaccales bacterium]
MGGDIYGYKWNQAVDFPTTGKEGADSKIFFFLSTPSGSRCGGISTPDVDKSQEVVVFIAPPKLGPLQQH